MDASSRIRNRSSWWAISPTAASTFFVRVWVKSADYWDVFFDANETIKTRLDEAGINIPYPTMDMNLHKA